MTYQIPPRVPVGSPQIKAAMKKIMERVPANSGERPPNLREGDARINCSTCQHFAGGICRLYDYHVEPTQVCDSWSPLPE